MTDPRGREPGSNKICFRNGVQLASFCPKAGKVVLVASSQHKQPMVDGTTGKPEVILYYNSTKGGVDVCDAIIGSLMCPAPVRRWPTRMLFFMISVACLNAYHLYVTRHPDNDASDVRHGGRMRFVRALGMQMVNEQVQRRAQQYTAGEGVLNRQTVGCLEIVLDQQLARDARGLQEPDTSRQASQRVGRCASCLREAHGEGFKASKSRMSKHTGCVKCGTPACTKHSGKICDSCQ